MDTFPVEAFHLLIFTIPGFFIVWSYRKFSKSNDMSDFEYLMFSLFWGLIMVMVFSRIVKKETFLPMLQNPYAAAVTFSFLGFFMGLYSAKMRLMLEDIYSTIRNKK